MNHALEYAVSRANELHRPLIVCFGLMDDYPEANERHYAFMLQGLADVAADLRARGIKFLLRHGNPPAVALELSQSAALVVCDRGYTRHQKRWRDSLADEADCEVVEVESDAVLPADVASEKQEFAARTLRPKIQKLLSEYLVPVHTAQLEQLSLKIKTPKGRHNELEPADPATTLAKLKVDRSVSASARFAGGSVHARRMLADFVKTKLAGYGEGTTRADGRRHLILERLPFISDRFPRLRLPLR